MIITKITDLTKIILPQYISAGDQVADATLGNGQDTLFLRSLVGDSGRVYAFDIQQDAILRSRQSIPEEKQKNIHFIEDSHENLDKYISNRLKAVIFNLGYLPLSDHSIRTCWSSTKIALEKALHLLEKNGILLVCVYPGHDEAEEYGQLKSWSKNLHPKEHKVIEINPINQNDNAPKLIICQKM